MGMFEWFKKSKTSQLAELENNIATLSVDQLQNYVASLSDGYSYENFDGSKFDGGFGATKFFTFDYWGLRARSEQLFNENLYAKGIIRRLVTNEINTGLMPEAAPDENVLDLDDEYLNDWSDNVESRYEIWSHTPEMCDYNQENTFNELQRIARTEALIGGDMLIIQHFNNRTKIPCIELVKGDKVKTPFEPKYTLRQGHYVTEGIEFNAQNRRVAFWVQQDDLSFKRVPVYGEKSKRKLAWMIYGTEKRALEVRGQPLLSIVLQSLKEIDRYRDSTQRKALINSFIALAIKKTKDKVGSAPMSNAAVKKGTVTSDDNSGGGTKKRKEFNQFNAGLILEELQEGEEIQHFGGNGTDLSFSQFEETIIRAVAWALQIPAEILILAFTNNYSASQAAINEFRIYLNLAWSKFGSEFCDPPYQNWLLSEVMLDHIEAPNLIESWVKGDMYNYHAWNKTHWYGSIKPSTDMVKMGKASELLIRMGLTTRAREARVTTGTKFSRNAKVLTKENALLKVANDALGTNEQDQTLENRMQNAVESALDDRIEA